MKYRRFAVLALGVLAFAAAGCGGDDSSSEASSDTQAEETTAEDTTAEDTTAEETTEDETMTEETTEDIDLGDLSGECLEFAGIGAKIAETLGAANGAGGDISETAELFEELVDNAPDEIKDDLAVLSEGIGAMAEALQGVDLTSGATPDPETLAKLQQALASVDSVKLQAASKNIEAWATENCTSN